MNASQGSTAMLAGGLAAALVLVCTWTPSATETLLGEPMVGLSAVAAAQRAPTRMSLELRPSEDLRRSAAATALEQMLPAALAKAAFKSVVLHGVEGLLPTADAEEGAAWHCVLALDGTLSITSRAVAGRSGLPPGSDAAHLAAIHVMVPQAKEWPPQRVQALGDLARTLLRRVRRGPEALSQQGVPVPLPQGWWP